MPVLALLYKEKVSLPVTCAAALYTMAVSTIVAFKRNKQKQHEAISAYLGLAVIMDTILGNSLENVPLL